MDNVIPIEGAMTGQEVGEESKSFYRFRSMWMENLCKNKKVTNTECRVAMLIAFRMRGDQQYSFPSQETIADELGMSRVTVARTVSSLKRKGILSVESGRTGRANRYRMCPQ